MWTYDDAGNITSRKECAYTTGSMASTLGAHNPLRYRGYVFDQDTELYYLQSRYYDPQVGRFINADAEENLGATGTVLGYNLFAYCENNPVNMVDATGMAAINVLFSAIGAIAGWVLGDYVAKALGYSSGWMYWAIRTGVTAGSAVVGWFAGSLMTKLLGNFLRSHLDVVFKMASKLGLSGFRSAMEFLGINPFSLATNSSKFIAIARLFNTTAITIGYDWAVKLYNVAINFGYKVIFHEPHGNYSWHIHLIGANGKLIDLHIQITKTAWDYLQKIWG